MKPVFIKNEICPQCDKKIPKYEDEVHWCKYCDWNLLPKIENEPNVFDTYYRKLSKSISTNLAQAMLSRDSIKSKWSKNKIFTILISLGVVSIPYLMLLFSVLAFIYLPVLIFIFISVFTLGLLIVYFAVRRTRPKDRLSREEAPLLYRLVDKIASRLNRTYISELCLIPEFNAFYTEYNKGLTKKRSISLGLPLIEILDSDELIALIAHEISHGANGDLMRSTLLYKAQRILAVTYFFLRPRHVYEGVSWGDPQAIMTMIGNNVGHFLSYIPLGLYQLITKLYTRDSQEAEYYADILATQAAGKNALIRLLGKLHYTGNYYSAVSIASLSNGAIDFFEELKKKCSVEKSDNELLRLSRIELHYGLSLDATHPPNEYRANYVRVKGQEDADIVMTDSEFKELKSELYKFQKKISNRIIDNHLDRVNFYDGFYG